MQRYPTYTVSTNIYTRRFAGVRLPSTLKNQYPTIYKVEAFYVRKSLLASFKEKFTNFTFLALEDSDYYKAHSDL